MEFQAQIMDLMLYFSNITYLPFCNMLNYMTYSRNKLPHSCDIKEFYYILWAGFIRPVISWNVTLTRKETRINEW